MKIYTLPDSISKELSISNDDIDNISINDDLLKKAGQTKGRLDSHVEKLLSFQELKNLLGVEKYLSNPKN